MQEDFIVIGNLLGVLTMMPILDSIPNFYNLDVAVSTRASETTLSNIKALLDKLEDALASIGTDKLLTAPDNPSNLDVALSTRASETTLNDIKTQTDKLQFDANKRLKVQLDSIPNPSNLNVALSTRASESKLESVRALLDEIEDALASVGTDKLRASLVDALPAGTNKIGSVDVDNFPTEYSLPSAQVSDLKNVNVQREGSITHINVTLSAAGSQTVYTPSTGKKAKVIGFFLKCDSDVDWELRFAGGNIIAGLPVKGAVAMNGVAMEMPTGDADETIEVYADGACTIKGWINVVEV